MTEVPYFAAASQAPSSIVNRTSSIAMSSVSAIVLAAGTSQRMGAANKLLLPYHGRPLVRHVVRTVAASAADEVIVVVGHEAGRVRDALVGLPVRIVHNDRYAEGMTTSIQTGVGAASPDGAGYMICLSDLPLIEPADLDRLIAAFRDAEDERRIVMPVFEGRQGNPVLFASAHRAEILAHDEPDGCRAIVRRHREHVLRVEMPDDHVLLDIDTPDAYDRVR